MKRKLLKLDYKKDACQTNLSMEVILLVISDVENAVTNKIVKIRSPVDNLVHSLSTSPKPTPSQQ